MGSFTIFLSSDWLTADILALIFGTIGAITGIIALFLQVVSEKSKVVSLIITEKSGKPSYYVNDSPINYESNRYAVINVKISNVSSLPITIDNVYVAGHKENCRHINSSKFNTSPDKLISNSEEGITYASVNNYSCMNIPFRIDNYHTEYVSFVFPFFDSVNTENMTLIIETPRKNFRLNLSIHEWI